MQETRGLVVLPHFPHPRAEHAASIVSGNVDAFEMTSWENLYGGIDPYSLSDWYRYLNCGYLVAAVGGTDKMSAGLIYKYKIIFIKLLMINIFYAFSFKNVSIFVLQCAKTFYKKLNLLIIMLLHNCMNLLLSLKYLILPFYEKQLLEVHLKVLSYYHKLMRNY